MNEFYQGLIGGITVLGGLCAFMYWVFNMMEKRLESKLDSVVTDVHKIANELVEERRSKDYLYKFIMDYVNDRKPKNDP